MDGWMAFVGGDAVGLVHVIRHRSTWTAGDYAYLQDLYTASPARDLGVGRRLIDRVYTEADNQNCSRVYWLTHEGNDTAKYLYDRIAERSGFIQYRKLL